MALIKLRDAAALWDVSTNVLIATPDSTADARAAVKFGPGFATVMHHDSRN